MITLYLWIGIIVVVLLVFIGLRLTRGVDGGLPAMSFIMVFLVSMGIMGLVGVIATSSKIETTIITCPIYRATVPFGTFLLNGRVGGSFLFFSGEISEGETYIIKYLENEQLKTITFKAEKTPLNIEKDRFEIVFTMTRISEWNVFGEWVFNTDVWRTEIFIPYLPLGENMTSSWGK